MKSLLHTWNHYFIVPCKDWTFFHDTVHHWLCWQLKLWHCTPNWFCWQPKLWHSTPHWLCWQPIPIGSIRLTKQPATTQWTHFRCKQSRWYFGNTLTFRSCFGGKLRNVSQCGNPDDAGVRLRCGGKGAARTLGVHRFGLWGGTGCRHGNNGCRDGQCVMRASTVHVADFQRVQRGARRTRKGRQTNPNVIQLFSLRFMSSVRWAPLNEIKEKRCYC